MINGEVWANVWQTECIARICPRSGNVTGWVLMHGLAHSVQQRNLAMKGKHMDVLNGACACVCCVVCALFVCSGQKRTLELQGSSSLASYNFGSTHANCTQALLGTPRAGGSLSPASIPQQIESGTSHIRNAISLTHPGIAWDASRRRLFVTGKYWPRLFEVSLKPLDAASPTNQQMAASCLEAAYGR